MRNRLIRIAFSALLAALALNAPANAQIEPPYRNWDENGVDLVQGDFELSFKEGSIGSGAAELSMMRFGAGTASSQWDRITYHATRSGGVTTVRIGLPNGSFEKFENNVNTKANGGTLVGGTYTSADGTKIDFVDPTSGLPEQPSNFCGSGGGFPCDMLPETITYTDGRTITFAHMLAGQNVLPPTYKNYAWRLTSITNSFGYSINFTYQQFFSPYPPSGAWYTRSKADFKRDGVTQATVNYAYTGSTITDVTDFAGNVWRVTGTATTKSIQRPGEATPFISATSSGLVVTSVTNNGVTTNYNRVVNGNIVTTTITRPLGQQTVVVSDLAKSRPTSITDALSRTTSYQYDANGRMTRVTQPEGNYTQYTYDARGNVTQARTVSKTPGTPADIVTTASFDASCANPVKCNKPNSRTDGRGNTTDYTYDATHGGITTVTLPAPTAGAVRPQTRFTYTLLNGEYQLTAVSRCQTLASCANAADEAKTTLTYDAYGNVLTSSSGNGTGTLTATHTMTYDAKGDLLTVDGPLAGTNDTTRFRYDAARRQMGAIAPDPDGAGTGLKHRAVRTTYDVAGRVTKQELGTVNSQSDPDWANFASLQAVDVTYDGSGSRVATTKLSAGGTAYALTQTSYDALGRLDCSAVRMNTAVYGSLPASACTLGTQGSFGPDRIGQAVYDAAGQLIQQKVAVGTTDAATERTLTYSNNGMLATLKDAENNLTTYEYDGFDRLSKTRFPDTTKASGTSSTTDYEQLTYDAHSNVTNRRLRDAQNIAFTLDNLNRVTFKNLPGIEPDVTYAYDNLGRLTSASQTGNSISFSYDALSRNLTQVGPQGTVTSDWDLAGRRTKLTYPGSGLFVDYDYLVTGEMTKVRENGATSGVGVLATYAYDDLGRRTSKTLGNGAVQNYGLDAVSRLASLTNDLSGTSNDLSVTFAYNPASQITSTVRTGDTYAWTGHGNGSTAYTQNGLNQQVTVGGSAATWDSKGNLTSEPQSGKTYGYSSENLLTSASGGAALGYDPQLRLYEVAGGTTTRFAYDGVNAVAEYNGSNALQRRYVFGPGMDEPIVQYEGTGTTDRRFMGSDERGSIISLTDGSGTLLNINRYDEYGKPQTTNSGRFQYTGQKWIGEAGLYDYKARDYLPHLGIFAQTDPLGMAAGTNLYVYVRNDPIGLVDPLGLVQCTGSHLNRDNCGNSPDPVSCLGSCGHWATIIDKTAAAAPTDRGGSEPTDYPLGEGPWSGYWRCTNCGQPAELDSETGEMVVTASHYEWAPYQEAQNRSSISPWLDAPYPRNRVCTTFAYECLSQPGFPSEYLNNQCNRAARVCDRRSFIQRNVANDDKIKNFDMCVGRLCYRVWKNGDVTVYPGY